MPGYNRQMLSVVNSKVDMNNRFQMLMNEIHHYLFLFQPNLYIVTAPEPVDIPSVIRVDIIWKSNMYGRHVNFSRGLNSEGNYMKTLIEIKNMTAFAFEDSYTLGNSPYDDLLFGVNYFDLD